MEKDYFMSDALELETMLSIPWNGLNSVAAASDDPSFLDHCYSVDQYSHLESALSSLVSSPVAASSGASVHELLGKLGNPAAFPPYAVNATAAGSCYSGAYSSSPPKLSFPIIDPLGFPDLGCSAVPFSLVPSFPTDPGFVERAAKFSCLGSWSFSGRTAPPFVRTINGGESLQGSGIPAMGNGKLSRVSSSPSFHQEGSLSSSPPLKPLNPDQSGKELIKLPEHFAISNEKSSVSDLIIPCPETVSKPSNELNCRKRKPFPKGKSDENGPITPKGNEADEEGDNKRSRSNGNTGKNNGKVSCKTEEEAAGSGSVDENAKQKTDQKPPPKDYIHVRARRGEATDSHSLAERVRREKISERMKLLQDLVPGCNKVTGKALMLDEIINYVQSLQRQVEFLSMKLASVSPDMNSTFDTVPSNMVQPDTDQMLPLPFLNGPSVPLLHNPKPICPNPKYGCL